MTAPFVDELDERADRILHDAANYYAEVREQARGEVEQEMARQGR
jgi:hypothetical protein